MALNRCTVNHNRGEPEKEGIDRRLDDIVEFAQ